jgi:hypothetical protein
MPKVLHKVTCEITMDDETVKKAIYIYESADPLSAIREINAMSWGEFQVNCELYDWL